VTTLPEVLRTPFLVHDSAPAGVWAADTPALEYLFEHVAPGARTLETGAGLSTVLFALKGSRHTCITPVQVEVDRIREHCLRHGIETAEVEFVVARSEDALPGMQLPPLDLAFLDGCHGFPAPMLDWVYTASRLKIGGRLLLDDTALWPVRLLRDFLASDPAWRLECELPKTAVFEKLAEGSERREWVDQPYVVRQTKALARAEGGARRRREAMDLLKQGRLLTLGWKAGRAAARRLRGVRGGG
jgi:hypothetical protein